MRDASKEPPTSENADLFVSCGDDVSNKRVTQDKVKLALCAVTLPGTLNRRRFIKAALDGCAFSERAPEVNVERQGRREVDCCVCYVRRLLIHPFVAV